MAAELGITPPTVKRNLKLLENSGVIKRIDNGVMTTRITVLLK
jgi:DNA-binding Lrp family transcriptional regulator